MYISSEIQSGEDIFNLDNDAILICDSPYVKKDFFSCSYDSFNFESGTPIMDVFQKDDIHIYEVLTSSENGIYVIPEKYLINNSDREITKDYFMSIIRSRDSTELDNDEKVSYLRVYTENLKGPLLESSLYIYSILIVLAFYANYKIFKDKKSKRRKTSMLYLSIVAISFFRISTILLVSFSLFDNDPNFIEHIYKYLTYFYPSNWQDLILYTNIKGIIFLSFSCVSLLLGFLIVINYSVSELKTTAAYKKATSIGKNYVNYVLAAGMVLIGLSVTAKQYNYLIILTVYTFVIYITKYYPNEISKFYKNKLFKGALAFSLLIWGTFFYQSYKSRNNVNSNNNLFSNELLVLPRKKTISKKESFREYKIKPDIPIFINSYMVFHPNYDEIINKNLYDFTASTNKDYFIYFYDQENDLKNIYLNPSLRTALMQDGMSQLFYVENIPLDVNIFNIGIDIKCDNQAPASYIRLIAIDEKSINADSIMANVIPVIYFPGCPENNTNILSYSVPIDLKNVNPEKVLFLIYDIDYKNLKNLKLSSNDKDVNLHFLNYSDTGTVEHKLGSDNLEIYSSKVNAPETFSNKGSIDLGGVINDLVKKGEIEDIVTIWSPIKYSVAINQIDDSN